VSEFVFQSGSSPSLAPYDARILSIFCKPLLPVLP
jgi:hypothetical protein